MAAFIAMTSWRGEYTDEYFAQPAPDPALFGMPAGDDGTRDDPLLSDRSWAITSYRPDVDALRRGTHAGRDRRGRGVRGHGHGPHVGWPPPSSSGSRPTVFPSHHGGFLGGESGYAGQPEAFARRLRDVLDDGT